MQERNIHCTCLKFSQHSDTVDPFLPLKKEFKWRYWDFCLHQRRNSCSPNNSSKHTTPDSFQSTQAESSCTAQTSLSCIPTASLPSLLVAWGWVVSCLRAGWEWKGAWPSKAAIPPVIEENVRPAANFARSQSSLLQFPSRNQEVTSSLVFHQDRDESASQSSFRKMPRRWSLFY